MKERESSDSNEEIQKVTTRQYGSGDKRADIALYKHQAQPLVLHQFDFALDSRTACDEQNCSWVFEGYVRKQGHHKGTRFHIRFHIMHT